LDSPLLEVRNLHHTYGDGTPSLRGVDLVIQPAEKVGMIGPNGSGKSSLLLCLNGLLTGQGAIRIAGEVLTPARIKRLRDRVGLVFQSPDDQLFMPTLGDDIAFGPINLGLSPDEVHRRMAEAAGRFGLSDMLQRPPHHLSMGQKHLSAIACVLAMRPALVMMDEPTSSLDPRSRRQVIEALQSLDAALLIASHDLTMVREVCGRTLVLDAGRVVADAAAGDILADTELLSRHGLCG
jgi:cobalt/nickel transport system ATP-binding protein